MIVIQVTLSEKEFTGLGRTINPLLSIVIFEVLSNNAGVGKVGL